MKYNLYGIVLKSEIPLYRINPCNSTLSADVFAHYGVVDEDIATMRKEGIHSSMNPERIWFGNQYGVFNMKNGNEIIISPNPETKEIDIASFILGWCIAFIFYQRNQSAIHSSAINIDGKAVLISGYSGAGKSTTALNIIDKGFSYLSDDIAMVGLEDNLLIHPAYPYQKICRDVAEKINDDNIMYVDENKDKFARQNTKQFYNEPIKLGAIFSLNAYDGDDIEIKELTGLDKLNGLMGILFLYDAYNSLGFPQDEIHRCLKIAEKVPIYKINRPKNKNTVEEISSLIINTVRKEVL